MPKKMEPPPKRTSLAERGGSRPKVVTFFKSNDKNFQGVKKTIKKKNGIEGLFEDLNAVSNYPFGVRRIVTPLATHDITRLEDFEDGKMYVMAPTNKKPKPLDVNAIQNKPRWMQKSLAAATNSADLEPNASRKTNSSFSNDSPRSAESGLRTVKKIMVMRNGNPHTKHMMLLNRNKIPSFESFLLDIGESFQLPAQRLFSSDGAKIESLSAIFNGSEDLFVVGTGVEKFRPGSYKDNSPFTSSSRQQDSGTTRRKSTDDIDQPPPKVAKKSRGRYRVWVATSEKPVAGTDATVSMTVYGEKGKSDDIVLGCGEGKFESGNEDEFQINVGNIGHIFKIRIGHDDSTEYAGWLCEEVRLQDVQTYDEMVFACGRWMAHDEDDGQTCRELPAVIDGKPAFPLLNYQVAVVTGNYWNAGTSAKVYLTIFGERGDTGPRFLHKTKRSKKFEKGKMDIFNVEAVSLGALKKILIGHDSTEPDDCWYLEKVLIKDQKGSSLESVFPCGGWLDATLDEDGQTSKEIAVNNRQINLEKEMWEQEKWKFQPGNQVMFVNKGLGQAIQIKADGSVDATVDPHDVKKTAIFELHKVKGPVYTISNAANPDYYLAIDSNKVTGRGKNNEVKLKIQADRSVVIESSKNPSQLVTFGSTGRPGDVRGHSIGPTRQFYIYVKGTFRDEGVVMLYTSRIQTLTVTSDGVCLATGQRSEEAHWRVSKVGESGSIRMLESVAKPKSYLQIKDGHCDAQGTGDEFCHFKVIRVKEKGSISLQSVASSDVCVGFATDGKVKPTIDTGEENVRLFPQIIQFGLKKNIVTPIPPTSAKPVNKRKKRVMTKQQPQQPAPLPRTPTPTPSPPDQESTYEDNNGYPGTPTPTPTPSQDGECYTPIPTPTPTPDGGLCDEFDADGDWKVWVKTGKVATKATVAMVVYGEDGVSDAFTLGKGGKELFKANEENEFKVNVLSIGDIYKIRIGMDTTSKKASWRLDQVKMKDMITEEQLVFKFKNRWLSRVEDDCDIWREAAAVRPGIAPLEKLVYQIQVTTGSEVGSSTDANIYICLFGEKGDTGNRRLIKSNNQNKFQESQLDVFELEAVTVMTPSKVLVGHDGKGPGAGWFLRDIVIKESKTCKMEYVFPCNRWLDEGQDDKAIERTLELGEIREIQPYEWQVYVTTGSDKAAGTTAMVTLVAYGDKDMTTVTLIPKEDKGFQPGTTEDFRVYLGDIGQLYKIRIGHDNCGKEASWYLKTVRMLDLNENLEVQFAFDRWLSEKHDDLDVWREVPAAVDGKKPLPVARYYIQVYTGSEENAATEANVYLQLIGKHGDSGKRHLIRSKNNKDKTFHQGQMDIFEIEAVFLGTLQKVVVEHDGKEEGQGWYLEKVVVKDSKNAKNEKLFSCKKWLDVGQDDKKIQRELVLTKPGTAPNKVTSESASSKVDSITIDWKQPTGGVTGYKVTCDPPDCQASEVILTDAKTTKAEFAGLAAGKAYQFDIVTMNKDMCSEAITLKTNAKPNPASDVALESTANSISVTWSRPEGEITSYKLRISPSDAKKSVLKIKDPEKTSAEFTGLTPAKKYRVEVLTVSGETEGEKVTNEETTKTPEIHVLKVTSAETTKATSDSLTVSWSKPEGDVNGYRLMILPADGTKPEVKIDKADKTTAEFQGLSAGQEYTVDVYTVFNDQESEKMTLTARTDLPKVNKVRKPSVEVTAETITVSWKTPEGAVTGYRLSCALKDAKESSGQELRLEDAKAQSITFEGLIENSDYLIRIYTLSDERESDRAKVNAKTKLATLFCVADAKAEASTDSVLVTWMKPEGEVTGYEVTCLMKDGGTQADAPSLILDSGGVTQATFDELQMGKEYQVQIVAVFGEKKSDPTSVTVETKLVKVKKVQNASIQETSPSTISVSWEKPEGEISGYLITYSEKTDTQTDSPDKKSDSKDKKKSKTKKKKKKEETTTEESEATEDPSEKEDSKDDRRKEDVMELRIDEPGKTEIMLEELKSDAEYIIKIYTVDGDRKSDRVKVTARTNMLVKLSPVQDLSWVSSKDTNSVIISWKQPQVDGNLTISGYHLICDLKKHEHSNKIEKENGAIKGIQKGTEHGDKGESKDNIDHGGSNKIEDTEERTADEDKGKNTEENRDVDSTGTSDISEVKARDGTADASGQSPAYHKDIQISGVETLSAILDGLVSGQEYLVKVFAVSDDGRRSQEARLDVVPKSKVNKVQNASIQETSPSTISVSWEKPEGEISGYLITYSEKTDTQTDSPDKKSDSKDKKKSKTKKKKKKEETTTEESEATEDPSEKEDSKDDRRKEDVMELRIDEPGKTEIMLEELKSDAEYIIKIYTVDGDRKSDRVKVTARTTAAVILEVLDPRIDTSTLSTITVSWKKPSDERVGAYRLTWQVMDIRSQEASGEGVIMEAMSVDDHVISDGKNSDSCNLHDADVPKAGTEEDDSKKEETKGLEFSEHQLGEKAAQENELTKAPEAEEPADTNSAHLHEDTDTRTEGNASVLQLILEGADTTGTTIEGLEPGRVYEITIYSQSDLAESQGVVLKANTKSQRDQPRDPKTTSTQSTIDVSWIKPEGAVTGYRVLCLPADASTPEIKIEDGDTTQVHFEELTPGRDYEVEIYAINEEVEGDKITVNQTTKPNPVLDPAVDSVSSDTIRLTWSRPEGDLSGYRIDYQPIDNGSENSDENRDSKAQETGSHDQDEGNSGDGQNEQDGHQDTEDGEEYISTDKQDTLDSSQEKTDSQEKIDEEKLDEEKLIDASEKSDSGEGDNEDSASNKDSSQTISIDSPDTTNAEITGLTPGQTYHIKILSVSGEELSEEVALDAAATPGKVVDFRLLTCLEAVTCTWSPPLGIFTGYRVTCSTVSEELEEALTGQSAETDDYVSYTKTLSHSCQEVSIEGVDLNDEYVVEIVTLNGKMESQSVALSTKPPDLDKLIPVQYADIVSSDNSLTITWSIPEGAIHSAYKITCRPHDTPDDTTEIRLVSSHKSKTTFSGLDAGTQYDVRVIAVTNGKESEAVLKTSLTDGVKMLPSEQEEKGVELSAIPNQVLDAMVSATDDCVSLSWRIPEGPVTGFKVVCHQMDFSLELIKILSAGQTSTSFGGLGSCLEYTLEVYAINGAFESDVVRLMASTMTAKLEEKEEDLNIAESPNKVVDASLTEISDSSLSLSWRKPDGPITGFRVECKIPPDQSELRILDQDKTMVRFSGLEEQTEYTVGIYSLNGTVESEAVVLTGQTTALSSPSTPRKQQPLPVLEARCHSTSDSSLKVSWKKPEGPMSGFKLTLASVQEPEDPEIRILDCSKESVEFKALISCTAYVIGIQTLDGQRESQLVQVEAVVTDPNKPLPVLDPKTSSTGDSVTVCWMAPECLHSGFRIVCRLMAEESQDTAEDKGVDLSEKKEEEEKNADTEAADQSNDASLEQTPSDHVSADPSPSSDEKLPSSSDADDNANHVSEKEVAAETTQVEFSGLEQLTDYSFEIFTVYDKEESQPVTVEEKTKKLMLPSHGDWKLWVSTADDSPMPTDSANVHIVVYGDKGQTEPIALTQDDQTPFQSSSIDEFDINIGDIGEIYKIRIGHEDNSNWTGWHLLQVKMRDQHTEEELVFDYGRWMSRQEDDFDIVRELPAIREGQDTLPVNVYHVSIWTGDRWAAYTDAKLWVILHGQRGDTGKRILYHSLNHQDKYMKGQTNEFKVEAVSLSELTMVEIGHDGIGYGAGTFISSVSVKESETADNEYLFACNSWLDDHMEDRQTSRQLQLLGVRPVMVGTETKNKDDQAEDAPDSNWKVLVKTSDCEDAGTTANTYLTVFGEAGRTQRHALQGQIFEPNSEQEFEMEIHEIGEISKIRLEHDNFGDSPSWHVQHVKLIKPNKPEMMFRVNAWLSSDQGDNPSAVKEIAAIRVGVDPLQVVCYTLQVFIKEDQDSTGTLPGLHIALFGEAGEMAKRELIRTDEPVSDGTVKVDTYQFEAISVGMVQKATLYISSEQQQDTWFIERVTVQEGRYSTTRAVLPCKMWFGNAIIGEDGNTVLQTDIQFEGEEAVPKDNRDEEDDGESGSKGCWTIWITPGEEDGMGSISPLSVQVYGEKGNSDVIPLVPVEGQNAEDATLDDELEDKQVKKLAESGESNQEDVNANNSAPGEDVADNTSEDPLENADKAIQGSEANNPAPAEETPKDTTRTNQQNAEAESPASEEQGADISTHMAYPPGCTRKLDIEVGEIGPIYKIRLIIDNEEETDNMPGIYLEKVKMKDRDTQQEFHFFVNRWLGYAGGCLSTPDTSGTDCELQQTEPDKLEGDKKKGKKSDAKAKTEKTKDIKDKEKSDVKKSKSNDKKSKSNDKKSKSNDKKSKDDEKKSENDDKKSKSDDKKSKSDDKKSKSDDKKSKSDDKKSKSDDKKSKSDDKKSKSDDKKSKSDDKKSKTESKKSKTDKKTKTDSQEKAEANTLDQEPKGEVSEGDEKASCYLELAAIRPDVPPLPVYLYELSVHTGHKAAASLDSVIYATIYGDRGDTGHRVLCKSNNQVMFNQGQVDVFTIEAVDILRPSSIKIGHQSEGHGAGWYLDTVLLKQSIDATTQFIFPCKGWMDSGVGDRHLERSLPLLGELAFSPSLSPATEGHWQVTVKTSDQEDGGTSAKVCLWVYGEKGKCCKHLLEQDTFQPGSQEDFEISADDIGVISKIRLEHDNSGENPSWHVDSVIMKNVDTNELLEFQIDRWLVHGQDSETCCEVPAMREGKEALPVHNYQIKVHTGDDENAATEGDIYITLHGLEGDSGERFLQTSNNDQKFIKGQVDVFTIEAVELGKVHSISVRNASDSSNQAWFLQKMVVKSSPKAEQEFVFPSSQWIGSADSDSDKEELKDAKSEVKLLLQDKWKCVVQTSDIPDCGTQADVSLVAYGDNGMSKVMSLANGQEGNFEPDKSAEFELDPGPYIGDIYKIRMELLNSKDQSWHLKQVDLQDCFSGESLRFEYNDWLSYTENDGQGDVIAEMPTLRPGQEILPVVRYYLQMVTGEMEDAGTDSEVWVTIFGERGDTGRRLLNKPGEGDKPFTQSSKKDVFNFDAVSVGNIIKVLLQKSAGKPWYMDRLLVKEAEFAGMEIEFRHEGWVGDKESADESVDIELAPYEARPSNTVAPLPDDQEPMTSKGVWKIFITSGSDEDAGIEANITMVVYGSDGISQPLPITQSEQLAKMEAGKTQEFEVNVGDVGQIYKVRIEHDGQGEQSSWFLDKIKMKDVDTKAEFSYDVSSWLSVDKEGCDAVVEVPAIWPETTYGPVLKYNLEIVTGEEENAGTEANVYLILKGEDGDTGKRKMSRQTGQGFSQGQTNTFTIQAVSLGKINQCIMGHDGNQPESGWFLDKVIVSVCDDDAQGIVFPCNRWLAVDKDDNQTEVELEPSVPSEGAVESANTNGETKEEDGGQENTGKEDETNKAGNEDKQTDNDESMNENEDKQTDNDESKNDKEDKKADNDESKNDKEDKEADNDESKNDKEDKEADNDESKNDKEDKQTDNDESKNDKEDKQTDNDESKNDKEDKKADNDESMNENEDKQTDNDESKNENEEK